MMPRPAIDGDKLKLGGAPASDHGGTSSAEEAHLQLRQLALQQGAGRFSGGQCIAQLLGFCCDLRSPLLCPAS